MKIKKASNRFKEKTKMIMKKIGYKVYFLLRNLMFVSCVFVFMGCNDMFDYSPYDAVVTGKTNINAENIKKIENKCRNKDTIRVVFCGDTQGRYDATNDFVDEINKRKDVDFVVHLGDISDFGTTNEYLYQRDILERLNCPYVVLLGNHDCLGTGFHVYKKLFGNPNFSFIAAGIKFVCLNTNAMEFLNTDSVPNLSFMKHEVVKDTSLYTNTVVCMHIPPHNPEFNNNLDEVFHSYVKSFKGILFCTAAHEHHLAEKDVFSDGIIYYITDCMRRKQYNLMTITKNNYTYEAIYF